MSALIEMAGLVRRNPAVMTRGVRRSYKTAKAMSVARRRDVVCQWTGRAENLHVHHIYSVSSYPMLAAIVENMVLLHASVHLWLPHAGDWTQFVPEVRDMLRYEIVETVAFDD